MREGGPYKNNVVIVGNLKKTTPERYQILFYERSLNYP